MPQYKSLDPVAVAVREEPIELSSFLKLAQVTMSGGEAKSIIQAGEVKVNGEVDNRRSRKLHNGDIVEVAGQIVLRVSVDAR